MKAAIAAILSTAIVILLTITAAYAEQPDESNQFSTLNDYLHYAQEHNTSLKNSFKKWQDTLSEVPDRTILDPKLTHESYSSQTQTQGQQERQKVGLSHTFELFGKKDAQADEAQAKAEAARLKFEADKFKLFWEVKDAYYQYAYLDRASQLIQEYLGNIEQFEQVRHNRFWTTGAFFEMLLAKPDAMRFEEMLENFERLKGPVKAKLNEALNRQPDAEIGRLVWEEFEPIQLNQSLIVDVLRSRNPQLAQLDKEIEAARSTARLAETQGYPDIGFGVDFIRTERSMASGIRKDERDPTFITFSMNLPLRQENFDAAQQRAMAEARKKEQEKIEAENGILAKAVRVIYEYEDSSKGIRLYRQQLPAGMESVKKLQNRYEAWMLDFADLIDAQTVLLSYRLGYERSLATNRQKLAELEMLTGTNLEQN